MSPVCTHCGQEDRVYKLCGKATRAGVYKCGDCRDQFTVTVGTIFGGSRVPLRKWLAAVKLLCCSRRIVSISEIQRSLGMTYKTAWRMTHRTFSRLGYRAWRYPRDFTWDSYMYEDEYDDPRLPTFRSTLGLAPSRVHLRSVLKRILGAEGE